MNIQYKSLIRDSTNKNYSVAECTELKINF
jgi:hypothetical protein